MAEANNAFFGIQAAYDELVPGFEALFEREDRDWPRFHAAVRELARAPMAERQAQLKAREAELEETWLLALETLEALQQQLEDAE